MKVFLFNIEHYLPFEEESQNYLMRLPVIHCGLDIEYHDYQFQKDLRANGRNIAEKNALLAIDEFKPDIVIYGQCWKDENISPSILAEIREKGIKVITMIWDANITVSQQELDFYLNSDCLIYIASFEHYLLFRCLSDMHGSNTKVLFGLGAYYVEPTDNNKDIKKYDVTFLGSRESKRVEFIEFLQKELDHRGINFNKLGGLVDSTKGEGKLTDKWIPWPEYFNAIRSSKICINSQTQSNRLQIQGKIFEIISRGTFCLSDNHKASEAIIPNNIVTKYNSPYDCIEKIEYYIKNSIEREAIEHKAKDWFWENFDYKQFWTKTLISLKHDVDMYPTLPAYESEYLEFKKNMIYLMPNHIAGLMKLVTLYQHQ